MIYPWGMLYGDSLELDYPPIFFIFYVGEVPVNEIVNFRRKNIGIDVDMELPNDVQLTLDVGYEDPLSYSYRVENILSEVKEEREELKEYFEEKKSQFFQSYWK